MEGSVEIFPNKILKNQNELGAKFTDNKGTKLMKKMRARSHRKFALCS